METPDLEGNRNDLSLVFWRLIRFAMTRALECDPKEFYLETRHDQRTITVLMKYTGKALPGETLLLLNQYSQSGEVKLPSGKMEKGVFHAINILKAYSAHVQFSAEDRWNTIAVTIPVNK
jgi:hypothetical protein